MQWRVELEARRTGIIIPTHKARFINLNSLRLLVLSSGFRLGFQFVFVVLILFSCGDIELNLSPKKGTLLQFLSLPLEFKQHHCTQFCKNRSSPSLSYYSSIWHDLLVEILSRRICIFWWWQSEHKRLKVSKSWSPWERKKRWCVCILRNPYLWDVCLTPA